MITLSQSTSLFPNMLYFLWPQYVTEFISVQQIKRWQYWQYKRFIQGQPMCHCRDKTERGCILPAPGLCNIFENFPIILGKQSTQKIQRGFFNKRKSLILEIAKLIILLYLRSSLMCSGNQYLLPDECLLGILINGWLGQMSF